MSKQLMRFVAFCSLLCVSTVLAQQPQPAPRAPGRIVGIIVGDAGPLIAADVSVLSARDTAIVATTATAADGGFIVEGLEYGRYIVRVTYLGFKTRELDQVALTASSPVAELGSIKLQRTMIAGKVRSR